MLPYPVHQIVEYMNLYTCAKCENLLYFENTLCLNCGSAVGFYASSLSMKTLALGTAPAFTDIKNSKQTWRYCENARHASCNWLIPETMLLNFALPVI